MSCGSHRSRACLCRVLRRWCANLGYVVDMPAWVTYGIRGDVVDVPTWVMWLCASIGGVLRWWIAWVILEEILVVS